MAACRPTTLDVRFAPAIPHLQRPSHLPHWSRAQRPHSPRQPLPCPLPVPSQALAASLLLARHPASRLATARTDFARKCPSERLGRVHRTFGESGDGWRRLATTLTTADDDAASGDMRQLRRKDCLACPSRSASLATAAAASQPGRGTGRAQGSCMWPLTCS